MDTPFKVKTDSFEGPLELLLELIEGRKLLVNDVALKTVADDYCAHVRSLEHFPADDVAQFIVIAATLILIKSRSLIPTLELSAEETEDIKTLERRLALYQLARQHARALGERFGAQILFEREEGTAVTVFAPDQAISVTALHNAALALLSALPAAVPELAKAVVQKVIRLEEMIERLVNRVAASAQMSFREFSNAGAIRTKEDKVNVIVGFLALLELVKEGLLRVEQEAHFDDIAITKQS